MRLQSMIIPAGALMVLLGAGGFSAEAGQRGGDQNHDRSRQAQGQSQGQARPRDGGDSHAHGGPAPAPAGNAYHGGGDNHARYDDHHVAGPSVYHGHPYYGSASPYAYGYGHGYANGYRYAPPVVVVPRHYYGPGGNFSVYFGWGSGYLYGSPYSGRVYGYSPGYVVGTTRYYGDVRLQIRPRGAAVYVDGYYAGVVDDFDGVFQRLTLDVGAHQIQVEAPGFAPQTYNVYADPSRTVDVRGDLFPVRP